MPIGPSQREIHPAGRDVQRDHESCWRERPQERHGLAPVRAEQGADHRGRGDAGEHRERQGKAGDDLHAGSVEPSITIGVPLQPTERRHDRTAQRLVQLRGWKGHQLERPPVRPESRGPDQSPDEDVVDVPRQRVEELTRPQVQPVTKHRPDVGQRSGPARPPARRDPAREGQGCSSDQMLQDDRPRAESRDRGHHAGDRGTDDRDRLCDRERPELKTASHHRPRLGPDRGEDEQRCQGQADRDELRATVEVRHQRPARHEPGGKSQPGDHVDDRKRSDLALRDPLGLDRSITQAEFLQHPRNAENRDHHRHDAELLG